MQGHDRFQRIQAAYQPAAGGFIAAQAVAPHRQFVTHQAAQAQDLAVAAAQQRHGVLAGQAARKTGMQGAFVVLFMTFQLRQQGMQAIVEGVRGRRVVRRQAFRRLPQSGQQGFQPDMVATQVGVFLGAQARFRAERRFQRAQGIQDHRHIYRFLQDGARQRRQRPQNPRARTTGRRPGHRG